MTGKMKMDLLLKKKSAEAIPSEYAQHYSLEGAKFSVTGACASSGSHNLPKSEGSRSPETPQAKEETIIEAFRHFQMV